MKFTDIMNESLSGFINLYTPEEKERVYKKAKTIYKVFKKGKVTRSDGVTFSYELGDFMRPRIDEDGNLELFASVQTITELTWCPINHEWMTELIEQKFERMFGIKIELTPPRESNLIKWTGKKSWDEEEPIELNESFEDGAKNRKARIMFKLLKNGVIGSENEPNKPMFRYELSDNMAISRTDNLEDVVIYTAKMKIVELNRECRRVSPSTMAAEVRKRFEKEGIYLKYPPVEKNDVDSHLEREMRSSGMLNEGKRYTEDDITDRDHKKVKVIHKILKTGKIRSNNDNITYRYILPDDYWLSINYETGNIIVVLTVNSNQRLVLYSKFDESKNENPVNMEYNAIYRYVENEIKKLYLIYDIEIVFDGYIPR